MITKILSYFNSESLRNKLVGGGAILSVANGSEQAMRFLRNIILTRILAPEIFGLMAIVLAFNNFLESFSEVGIKQAVIHFRQAGEEKFLHSAWLLAVFRSVFLYLITFFASPFIADFYNNPELTTIIRFAFLSILFRGFMSIKAYLAVKEMKFGRWAILFNGGGLIGVILSIILGFYLRNVWALVIGFTAEGFMRLVLSYVTCPYRPSLVLERDHFKPLIQYARGMLGLPILTFIFMRTDIFVIGKLNSKYSLGLYSMAVALAYIPANFLMPLISEIAMPLFASLQDKTKELKNALIKVTYIITILSLPVVVCIVLYSQDILLIIYGKEYAAVAFPFSVLAITAFLRLLSTPMASLYMAIGEPSKHRFFTILRAVIMLILIYPAVKYFGLIGGAFSGLIAMFIGFFLQFEQMKKLIQINRVEYYFILIPAILFSVLIIGIWFLTRIYTINLPIWELSVGVTSMIFSYLVILIIHYKYKNMYLWNSIK